MVTPMSPTTCSARVGFWADEWKEQPLFCSIARGLVRYTDAYGLERAYCRHHRELVLYRYPTAEQARIVAAIERISGEFISAVAEMETDDEPEFDREGQPEFNGAFR